jgi:hypothetical protein
MANLSLQVRHRHAHYPLQALACFGMYFTSLDIFDNGGRQAATSNLQMGSVPNLLSLISHSTRSDWRGVKLPL